MPDAEKSFRQDTTVKAVTSYIDSGGMPCLDSFDTKIGNRNQFAMS
jgi:hypothetical protein